MSFEQWMAEVDEIFSRATGMSVHDVPDQQFRDAFDGGETPEEFTEETFGVTEDGITDMSLLQEALFG